MSKSPLSDCVNRIEESPTLAITAKALKLKAEGKDIIGLAAGEPDFDTPDLSRKPLSMPLTMASQNTPLLLEHPL